MAGPGRAGTIPLFVLILNNERFAPTDGTMHMVSPSMEELFGVDLQGASFIDLIQEDSRKHVQPWLLGGRQDLNKVWVQMKIAPTNKTFDCNVICYMRTRRFLWLSLQLVGETWVVPGVCI